MISKEDLEKLANYDKLVAERDMYKSDNLILKTKSKNNDKRYLKMIEEKNKIIMNLENELAYYKNKQMDIFEV